MVLSKVSVIGNNMANPFTKGAKDSVVNFSFDLKILIMFEERSKD